MKVKELLEQLKSYDGLNLEVRFTRKEHLIGSDPKASRREHLELSDENPFVVLPGGDEVYLEISLVPKLK
jgi:hypothetical protein